MGSPSQASLDAFLGLTEDQQRKALSGMRLETKQALLKSIKERPPKEEAKPPASAVSRFGESFGAASGLRHPIQTVSTLGHQILHPVETAKAYGQENRALFDAAKDAYGKGNYLEATRHAMNYLLNAIPGLGSSLDVASEQMEKGDVAGGLGTTLGVGTVMAGPEVAGKGLSLAGKLRQKAAGFPRKAAQYLTRSEAEHTTRPLVESYLKKSETAATKQAEIDAATELENRRITEKAFETAGERKAGYEKKVGEQKTTYEKAVATRREEQRILVKARLEENRAATQINARRESISRSMEEGSNRLGEQVKDLDAKLREEGNGKYNVVRQATAQDPGVPATDLIQAVEHAQQNILKGSQESIKQFREILGKKSEAEQISAGAGHPIDISAPEAQNILNFLESEGVSAEPANITFRDLQGYSSEIGAKIAEGPKAGQGDVYRALKYVKDKIDASKLTIAERNNVGDALRDADSFWHSYMDTFYDKDSAVAGVRKSVGVLDPRHYAISFVRGKAAEVAIGKLKQFPTQYAAEASSIANLAQNLRSAQGEVSALPKTAKIKGMPPSPPAVETPKPIEPPKPVVAEYKVGKKVKEPEPPTAEGIIEAKKRRIESKSAELGGIRRFDVMILLAPVIALRNLEGIVAGAAGIAAEKAIAASVKLPKVMDWIAKATPADIAAIEKLPEPSRTQLRNNLSAMMKMPSAPKAPSPALRRFIGAAGVGATAQPVKNRKEALELLKKNQ